MLKNLPLPITITKHLDSLLQKVFLVFINQMHTRSTLYAY